MNEPKPQPRPDAASKIPGATTGSGHPEEVLAMVVFRDRLCEGVRRMRGAGLVDVFHEDSVD